VSQLRPGGITPESVRNPETRPGGSSSSVWVFMCSATALINSLAHDEHVWYSEQEQYEAEICDLRNQGTLQNMLLREEREQEYARTAPAGGGRSVAQWLRWRPRERPGGHLLFGARR